MRNKEIYMQRLLVGAIEANQVEVIREELKKIIAAFQDQPRFLEILKSPAMTSQKRKEWLEEAFSGEVSQTLVEFLVFLVHEEAFDHLGKIEQLYDGAIRRCLEEHFNLMEGVVYSALPLEGSQLKQLEGAFAKKFDKQVKLDQIVDSSLIGGYRVEVGGHVYDDTIDVQLQQLKESLNDVDLY